MCFILSFFILDSSLLSMSISLVDMFMFLQSVRNLNSFKLAVRRLEEVALSIRGRERV